MSIWSLVRRSQVVSFLWKVEASRRDAEVTSIAIALLVFAGCLAAALLAVALQLPRHHLDDGSRDVVKSVMGLIATLSALVLGLLVASANSSYQTLSNQLDQMAANLVELNRALEYYGPEAAPARALVRRVVGVEIERIWPHGHARLESIEPGAIHHQSDEFVRIIGRLSPQTDVQRFEQKRIRNWSPTSHGCGC